MFSTHHRNAPPNCAATRSYCALTPERISTSRVAFGRAASRQQPAGPWRTRNSASLLAPRKNPYSRHGELLVPQDALVVTCASTASATYVGMSGQKVEGAAARASAMSWACHPAGDEEGVAVGIALGARTSARCRASALPTASATTSRPIIANATNGPDARGSRRASTPEKGKTSGSRTGRRSTRATRSSRSTSSCRSAPIDPAQSLEFADESFAASREA